MRLRGSDAVSPTAYYTGEVWVRHGLAPESFRTRQGVAFYNALRPGMAAARLSGGPTLEDFLLARHRLIDHELAEAIDAGRVGQVVEVASGLSPRGLRFAERYGDRITYVETDLPAMAERKRAQLDALGALSSHHRVLPADVLATGPGSLAEVLAGLDPDRGVAVVSEGLLNYLPVGAVRAFWHGVASGLAGFPAGLHLTDLHLSGENHSPAVRLFTAGLGAFVRGRIHLHFGSEGEAVQELLAAGFDTAELLRPNDFPAVVGSPTVGARLVRVVRASVSRG